VPVQNEQKTPHREKTMPRLRASLLAAGLLAVLAGGGPAQAGDVPDLSKIDRRIGKQPAYKAKQPLYGLYLFGPEARPFCLILRRWSG
jgi:hypothetical protein